MHALVHALIGGGAWTNKPTIPDIFLKLLLTLLSVQRPSYDWSSASCKNVIKPIGPHIVTAV